MARPADDAPRLVYADWCDEQGRGDEAALIRLQCRLAHESLPDAAGIAESRRLLPRPEASWAAGLDRELGASSGIEVRYRRGLPHRVLVWVSAVSMGSSESDFRRNDVAWPLLNELMSELAPRLPTVQEVVIVAQGVAWRTVDQLTPALATWRHLDSFKMVLPGLVTAEALRGLFEATDLRSFVIETQDMRSDAVLAVLQEALPASQLEHFEWCIPEDRRRGSPDLADGAFSGLWDHFVGLRSLALPSFPCRDWSCVARCQRLEDLTLAAPSTPSSLENTAHLPLRSVALLGSSDAVIAALPAWRDLTHLTIGLHPGRSWWTGDEPVITRLDALGRLESLRSLRLSGLDKGLAAQLPRFAPWLRRLDVGSVELDDVAELASLGDLRALHFVAHGGRFWDDDDPWTAAQDAAYVARCTRALSELPRPLRALKMMLYRASVAPLAGMDLAMIDLLAIHPVSGLEVLSGLPLEQIRMRSNVDAGAVTAMGRLSRLRVLDVHSYPVPACARYPSLAHLMNDDSPWRSVVAHPSWRDWVSLVP